MRAGGEGHVYSKGYKFSLSDQQCVGGTRRVFKTTKGVNVVACEAMWSETKSGNTLEQFSDWMIKKGHFEEVFA